VKFWHGWRSIAHESLTNLHCYDDRVPTAGVLFILILVFFVTSIVSVVTGSTSLITVPVMISLGIEPHVAVTTNMLALTLMSLGGSLSFIGKGVINRTRLPLSVALTIFGSALGALLLLKIPLRALQLVIAIAMIAIALFSLLNRSASLTDHDVPVSRYCNITGYILTFFLGVYGGFFSGGYVTILTAAFVLFFGMTLLHSMATTKVVNIFSSAVATAVFAWRGALNYKLGLLLGLVMFVGAMIGARTTLKMSPLWLRRVFLIAVFALALKMVLNFVKG